MREFIESKEMIDLNFVNLMKMDACLDEETNIDWKKYTRVYSACSGSGLE
jgi:hypothetical protein